MQTPAKGSVNKALAFTPEVNHKITTVLFFYITSLYETKENVNVK